MVAAVAPTAIAAPMARGADGRLPPIRSTTTRLRKPAISSPSPHEREELRFRAELDRERFLAPERPLLDDPREAPRLRLLEPRRLAERELLLDRLDPAFLPSLVELELRSLTTSPSWITPRQAPVSTSCISMKALKRARSARTARFT